MAYINSTIELFTRDQNQEHFSLLVLVPTGFLCVVGAFGNTLVIIAIILYPNLRNPTNNLLVSLAFTDLVVCLWVMPGAIYDMVPGKRGTLGKIVCNVWTSADIMMSCASIWHLCAISFDRFTALQWPIWYRKSRTIPMTGSLIFASWFFAFFATVILLVGSGGFYSEKDEACVVNVSIILDVISPLVGFVLPAVILITLYFKITYSLYYCTKSRPLRGPRAIPGAANCNRNVVKKGDAHSPSLEARTSKIEIRIDGRNVNSRVPTITGNRNEPEGSSWLQVNRASAEDTGIPNNDDDGECHLSIPTLPHQRTNSLRVLERLQVTPSALPTNKTRPPIAQRGSSPGVQKRERRATVIILIVVTAFFLCWGPFFVITTVASLSTLPSPVLVKVNVYSSWLAYSNSVLNPVIYTVFNASFRYAFKKMLTFRRHRVGVIT